MFNTVLKRLLPELQDLDDIDTLLNHLKQSNADKVILYPLIPECFSFLHRFIGSFSIYLIQIQQSS
jgi:hypothetical protein